VRPGSTATWSRPGQRLAEFLAAVSAHDDESRVAHTAVEHAVIAVAAEAGALLRPGVVVSAVGEPPEGTSWDRLALARQPHRDHATLAVRLNDSDASVIVLTRRDVPFSDLEVDLARAMAGVLSLVLRMIETLAAERKARALSEHHADENARLLAGLQERQSLLERLFKIQRSISHRAPTRGVLDAITEGAAELLGDEVVGLRLLDPDDPSRLVMVASVGVDRDTADVIRYSPVDEGIGGYAIQAGTLVLTHEYAHFENPLGVFVESGLQTAMAAPVFQDGKPTGSLVVASYDPDRRYGEMEQEMLLAFAEHASLALNDASALDAMRDAVTEAIYLAQHDPLTGLPNRSLVLDRLSEALESQEPGEPAVGVLFVDLDRFKIVNDTMGHAIGDELLIRVGERLRAAVRPTDTVGRLAGDEFVVLCEGVGLDELVDIAERVADTVAAPLSLYGRDAVITASIGVAHVARGPRAEDVLRDADVAMYRAKERGRARIELFDHADRVRLLERVEVEHALRVALQRDEFVLHYQPIFRATTGELIGVEALVRWARPGVGLVHPDGFVPLAEDTGLIVPIGTWVLREACAQLGRWRRSLPAAEHLQVSVNLSARQFTAPDLVLVVADSFVSAGLPGGALSLEITESVLMEEAEATTATLRVLKELGVSLSVDDFGTGYSSLSYLKRFPVDVLKVDRTFVDGLRVDSEDQAIVAAVISLAAALGLDVIAEGVETEAQLDELRRLGCTAVQGYLLGRPVGADDFERLLAREPT
jgi:diguanylate cyclase (GGDEF)-like protein